MNNVEIREAKREDCAGLRKLIQELADFENMPDGPKISSKDLEKDGFDSPNPLFHCFVATLENEIIGYGIYFYIYSTWVGKSMHLEDIYVTARHRKKLVGSRLFETVVKKAVEMDCYRLDFSVLNWNPARDFYLGKGAINISEKEGWQYYRLERTNLESLVANSQNFS